MQYEHITTTAQLSEFCQKHADATVVGFDTEFVSEDTYRPDLCLVQVAVGKDLAVIDPHACGDVTEFWEWLAADGHETIVHAEMCIRDRVRTWAALLVSDRLPHPQITCGDWNFLVGDQPCSISLKPLPSLASIVAICQRGKLKQVIQDFSDIVPDACAP